MIYTDGKVFGDQEETKDEEIEEDPDEESSDDESEDEEKEDEAEVELLADMLNRRCIEN